MSKNNTNSVGIIANPASGRDIRRLVAHGAVFNNDEKVNIVRRVLLGLEAVGVERVFFMPDSFSIGPKALDGLQTKLDVSILPMLKTFSQNRLDASGCAYGYRGGRLHRHARRRRHQPCGSQRMR